MIGQFPKTVFDIIKRIVPRDVAHFDAGHERFQDKSGNEIGVERDGGIYRAVIVLTNTELDWFFIPEPREGAYLLEIFETGADGQRRRIRWETGLMVLHLFDIRQLEPRVTRTDDAAIRRLFSEVRERDEVRWALTSDLFQSETADELPQPTVEVVKTDEAPMRSGSRATARHPGV